MEIEEQGGEPPDSVLVSVGGGGLDRRHRRLVRDRSRVIALEPELAPTLFRAREAGAPVDVPSAASPPIRWAPSASARSRGTSRSARARGAAAADEAIRAAQLTLWKEFKLAVEPAAALGLAALQTGAYVPASGRDRGAGDLRRQRGSGDAGLSLTIHHGTPNLSCSMPKWPPQNGGAKGITPGRRRRAHRTPCARAPRKMKPLYARRQPLRKDLNSA
jgi:hypothetical protein